MTARGLPAVVKELSRRRVAIRRQGDRIHLHGPRGAIDPELLDQVRARKPDLIAWLGHRDCLLEMSLREFEQQGLAIEMRVPWVDGTLWLVPKAPHVAALLRQGIRRGRIWTLRELADFVSAPGVTRQDIANIARLKVAFGAEIVSIEPDDGPHEHSGDA